MMLFSISLTSVGSPHLTRFHPLSTLSWGAIKKNNFLIKYTPEKLWIFLIYFPCINLFYCQGQEIIARCFLLGMHQLALRSFGSSERRVSPNLEKSGNFKRHLENLELSGNFILIDKSQGNLKMSKLLYLYIRKNVFSFQGPDKWKNSNY